MKYMGSKRRLSKFIIPILMEHYNDKLIYVEPFVGGANIIDKMPIPNNLKYGYDINEYLISLWKTVSKGYMPPKNITENDYHYIKNNKDENKVLTGYVGFALSYGGKWFGGWRRDNVGKRDYVKESYKDAIKQFPLLRDINFQCISVFDLNIKTPSLIYCDPPYKNTTKYNSGFNHNKFYDWCRQQFNNGHKIFVSEYNMPEDFKCVWEKDGVSSSLTKHTGNKKSIEKLFTLEH